IGAPKGAGIYFAVDMDAGDDQIQGDINDYFTAVKGAIGADYVPGVYGNGAVCAWCLDHGLTQLAWVWAGRLTNGTQAFVASDRWNLHQHPPVEAGSDDDALGIGIGYDPDDFKDSARAFVLTDTGANLVV
ncbi:MAG TPA: glycoside hydrolase domain-containing protein, partial [Stellaceae bacterium]|nr:glycoside hydrolase domain-containing protein [Stellaceae bacterium]